MKADDIFYAEDAMFDGAEMEMAPMAARAGGAENERGAIQ